MARASTPTKLPLDEWAKLIGIDPLHFNQVNIKDTPQAVCDSTWFQHDWQASERVGREAVARAIREAEDDIERLLGFRLLPSWETDEWRQSIRPYRPELVNINARDVRGYQSALRAKWGYFVSGGVRATTLLDADAAIVYTDADGDGYDETATVTVAVPSGTAACEVRAFFPGESEITEWEIRPVTVTVAGLVATLVFRRELCVLPDLTETYPVGAAIKPSAVDGMVDANFLTTVDVYRVYNDPQTQATFLWEQIGSECGCGDATCVVCQYNSQTGCLILRSEPRLSMVAYHPATWDADDAQFTVESLAVQRVPDIVRLWYYAGYQDQQMTCPRTQMAREWARVVAIYAASILDRPLCDCKMVAEAIRRWQKDLAFIGGADELSEYNITAGDLNNPLGTRAGAVHAWKRITRMGADSAIPSVATG